MFWALYCLGHVKRLIQGVAAVGYVAEHQDTLQKFLGLSLLEQIPAIQAGWIPIALGCLRIFMPIGCDIMAMPININGLVQRGVRLPLIDWIAAGLVSI